jgi:hypothetical protein
VTRGKIYIASPSRQGDFAAHFCSFSVGQTGYQNRLKNIGVPTFSGVDFNSSRPQRSGMRHPFKPAQRAGRAEFWSE